MEQRGQEERPHAEPKDEYAELIALLKEDKEPSYQEDVVWLFIALHPRR